MSVLIDSDILIEVLRRKNSEILARWMELSRKETGILYSPVSAAELWAGARPAEYEVIDNLFRLLTCAAIDAETGRQAGDYIRRYGKSHGVQLGDALIAATAVLNGAVLWTRNQKHYPMKQVTFF